MSKLKPLEVSIVRGAMLAAGLRALAIICGKEFDTDLNINSNGEIMLRIPLNGDPQVCGEYGERLAAILSPYRPRCGYSPMSSIDPRNGWCYMNHFDVERMLLDQGVIYRKLS